MRSDIKVGVIGAGNWGKNLVSNFHGMGALTAVADASPVTRQNIEKTYPGVKIYEDYRSLLKSDIGAVAIATPVATHYEVALEALNAGKDVFVEKPIALVTKEAQDLADRARKGKQILMVGHLLLFQPAVQKIKSSIDAGLIGELRSLHQERLNLGKARSVENALWSLGVHDVAVLLYLAGKAPTGLKIAGQRVLQATVEDDVYLHMDFGGKFQAHLHNSWLWPERRRQLTVVGSKAMLVYDEIAQKLYLHKKSISSDLQNRDEGTEVIFDGASEPLRLELEHFISCIRERKSPVADGQSAVQVVQVLEEASRLLEAKSS